MKKILFAPINAKYVHSNLAFLYLRKITGNFGADNPKYSLSIEDYSINLHSYDILAAIANHKPDVICFSVYIWNTKYVKELLSDLPKVLPNAVIVLGGPEVSYNPEKWFQDYERIDYIVTGGGEAGWLELLRNDFSLSKGIIRTDNIPFDDVPFPYDDELFAQTFSDDYNLTDNKIIYYESSRGCPFKCSFCLSSRRDIRLEFRSIDKVTEELDYFISKKIPLVKFIDRTFNAKPGHYRAIWEYLLRNNIDTKFHFEINPTLISNEDVSLLKRVPKGWFQFEMGIQSIHPQTLKEIGRGGGYEIWESPELREEMFQKIKLLQENIDIHLDLISGLPYEDYHKGAESFNTIYGLQADTFQTGMLKVLPGTEMAEKADSYGMEYQAEAPYRVLKTKWITFEELNKLYNIEHLVNNLYNSHKFVRTIDYLIRLIGSPFALFEQLESFWYERMFSCWLKDWNKTALIMIEFVNTRCFPLINREDTNKRSNITDAIEDCLRYDLCFHTGLRSFPAFLLKEETELSMKEWQRFKGSKSFVDISKKYPTITNSRGILIFKPISEDFCILYDIGINDCILTVRKVDGTSDHIRFRYQPENANTSFILVEG